MEIVDVLFFLVNIIVINSSVVRVNKPVHSGMSLENSKVNVDQYCADLSETIRLHKLSNYINNCKVNNQKKNESQEEYVLQNTCYVVKNMFNIVCTQKLDKNSLNLVGREDLNNICPFNFSHVEHLDVFKNYEIVKQLSDKDFCQRTCYTLTVQLQCVVLVKFNNYLKNFEVKLGEVNELSVKPQITNASVQKTSEIIQPSQPIQSSLQQATHLVQSNQPQTTSQHVQTKESQPNQLSQTQANQLNEQQQQQLQPVEKNLSQFNNHQSEKINQPDSIDLEQPQSIQQINDEEDNEFPGKTEGKTLSSNMGEVVESSSKKEKKTEKFDKTDDINLKIQDQENVEVSPKNEDKFQDDFNSNEDGNLPQAEDESLLNDPNQEPESWRKHSTSLENRNSILKEKEALIGDGFSQSEDSHFFFYFIMMSSIVVVGYLAFHNKNKILAYALEGSSGRRSRRRPNPARYRKLETNLEEAMSSGVTNSATSSVVY